MEIKNIKREDGKLSFQVCVDAEAFEKAVNQAYLKAKKSIYVPGFRKGKAPRMVIEGMYGAKVFYDDAVDAIALDAFKAGMDEAKDRTVGDPAITKYDVDDAKCLSIDFETALYPEVTLGQYKGLEAEKDSDKVSAAEVNAEIESVRSRNARIVTVERKAAMGDTVNLDYDGYKDGVRFDGGKAEGQDLVLGSHSFVPGFEEQIVGMAAGDEKDIDITFPENYHEGLSGAAAVFKIKVNEVKESQLPTLDDEFAKDVSEFDTLKDYKASIKKDLTARKKANAEENFRNAILSKAVENMTVEIPAAMINERVNQVIADYTRNCAMQGLTLEQYFNMMGVDEATFRGFVRPNAERDVRSELLLEKVAEVENIEVTPEEIEDAYAEAAKAYNTEIERVKSYVDTEIIARDVKLHKAFNLIVDSGVAVAKAEPAAVEGEAAAEKAEKKPAAKKATAKKAAPKKAEEEPKKAEETPEAE